MPPTRGHTKCCTGHAKSSSSSSSQNATLLRDRALRPQNIASTAPAHCASHDFHKVSDPWHLLRKLAFQTSKRDDFIAPAMRIRARTNGKTVPSKSRKSRSPQRQLCAILRSRNAHGHLTKELLRELAQLNPLIRASTLMSTQSYSYRKNPKCRHTVWGKTQAAWKKVRKFACGPVTHWPTNGRLVEE